MEKSSGNIFVSLSLDFSCCTQLRFQITLLFLAEVAAYTNFSDFLKGCHYSNFEAIKFINVP